MNSSASSLPMPMNVAGGAHGGDDAPALVHEDPESQAWIARLDPRGGERAAGIASLRELLLDAARFELDRHAAALLPLAAADREAIARLVADHAVAAALDQLDDFRGDSHFTTWACKFALSEAAATIQREAWDEREVPVAREHWHSDPGSWPEPSSQMRGLRAALDEAIETELTALERGVLVAFGVNHVPIDVLADRLGGTRSDAYMIVHDARQKLRGALGLPAT